MNVSTYLSSDDSALLRSVLRKHGGGACLEVGAGNAGALVELSQHFGLAAGTDLHRPSDDSWRASEADYVLADAASCFREGSFDLVAFNPPYVPSEGLADDAVDGGTEGIAVTIRFLLEAFRVLKNDGRVVMLLSSDNPVAPINETCERHGLAMKLVRTKRLFYETLSAYEISRRRPEG